MSAMIFAADLWQKPEGWEPTPIDHPDPLVMTFARILLNADPEYGRERMCSGIKVSPWDYQVRGATQGHDYYEMSYRSTIAEFIQMAVDVIDGLRREGIIPE